MNVMDFTNSDFIFDSAIGAKDKTAFCRKWLYSWERQNLPALQTAEYLRSKWSDQVTLLIHSFQPDEGMFYVNEFPILHTWKMLGRLPVVITQVCHLLFRECPFDPIDMRLFSSSPHNFRLHHQKTDIDDFSPVSSPFLYAWGVTFTPNALRIAPISSPSTSSI